MAFVRQSKFRNVFGSDKKEDVYEGFRATNCAFEGTFIAVNAKLIAFCVEVGGSGAFCVIPVSKTGRLDVDMPKVNGHKEYVLDLKWNPFDDAMLASCSEDGSIRLWEFDDKLGLISNIDTSKALVEFEYHQKRCVQVSWHPIARNVLMSVSQEPKICLWNLDEGVCEIEFDESHLGTSIPYSADWSMKGDKIVTISKDKKIRVFKARFAEGENPKLMEASAHEGSKPQRVVFTFNDTMLFSTGFSKMSERQYACWKINGDSSLERVQQEELDTSNGVLIPYYDSDTQMMYLAAKGDTVIRYYEITKEDPYYHYISTYQTKDAQRSLCHIPKRSVDPNLNEMVRFYKMISAKTGSIKACPFINPRKSDLFQEDIYPDAISIDPAIEEASEWFAGTDKEPNRVSMATFFVGKTKSGGSATGGGLKKGGLKGLKAKKDAKDASKKAASSEPAKKAASPEPAKPAAEKPAETKPSSSSSSARASSPAAAAAGADPKIVKQLQDDIKSLKDNEKKMQKEIKGLNDKLKDYDKLTSDIKLLCDAVKKNDERLNALEALVQEESENEGEE